MHIMYTLNTCFVIAWGIMETDSVQTISQINRDLEIDNAQSEVCCGGIQRKLRSLLPVNYKDELLLVLKLAGPVVSVNIKIYLI